MLLPLRLLAGCVILIGLTEALPCQLSWMQGNPVQLPGTRHSFGMAFDPIRQETVLFGGVNGNTFLSDTWVHTAGGWEQRVVTGPSARSGHAMAFDHITGTVILFSGARDGQPFQETWSWDGAAWTQLSPVTSPVGRTQYAMASYNHAGQSMVLFGGQLFPGGWLGDTWFWNGSTWIAGPVASPSGPAAQPGQAMAFDVYRHRVVLYGGAGVHQGTWEWDGASWSNRTAVGQIDPGQRSRPSMAFDEARNVTVLFGGLDSNFVGRNDTWEWNGTSWLQRMLVSHPPGRLHHNIVYDQQRNLVLLFGGINDNSSSVTYGDTWELRAQSTAARWHPQYPVAAPSGRWLSLSAFDAARNKFVVFGGTDQTGIRSDVWEWDGCAWDRRRLASSGSDPNPVSEELAMVYYGGAVQRPIVVGNNLGSTTTKIWQWDGVAWGAPQTVSLPVGTVADGNNIALAYDQARLELVMLLGGYQMTTLTWSGGPSWTHHAVAQYPTVRNEIARAMVFDSRRNVVVLFGGNQQDSDEVWEWNGSSWTGPIQPTVRPLARGHHAVVFDEALGAAVVFGGVQTVNGPLYHQDAWSWDGLNWRLLCPVCGPTPRAYNVLGYDGLRRRTVLFGGGQITPGSVWEDDTWELYNAGSPVQFGPACAGTVGLPELLNISEPTLGAALILCLRPVPSASFSLGFFTDDRQYPPLSLSGLGMPGCYRVLGGAAVSSAVFAGTGSTRNWSAIVPNSASYLGLRLVVQALTFDPGANPAGLITSNGLDLVIESR